MRKTLLSLTAAVAVTVPALSAPALAYRGAGDRYERYHDNRGHYSGPTWRGQDGRLYCRRSNGTTGLIVGGAAGALLGRAIDTRGERTTGTVLGGVVGALVGREIQRGRSCR